MPVKNRFAELMPEMTAWRHDFHAHPELLFDVGRTAGKVADLLRAFGCDRVVEGIGRTGVVGVINGQSLQSGRVVGLRADMDALPITEQTGLAYASTVPGKMHACGHDGHTSMLLGAAKYLCETRNFDGQAVVIFQPAEEAEGGGLAMVNDGLMERFGIQEVYAMHNQPGLPVGQFAIRSGPVMAAADQFKITVIGKGGHAAKPHEVIDPVVVAAQIILALQTITSRNINPADPLVVSVATLAGDSAVTNVISQKVEMAGTVRSFSPAVRDLAQVRLTTIATSLAETFGARAEVEYTRGYPATVNSEAHTGYAIAVAQAVAGADAVDCAIPAQMAAEDFSYMLEARPGAYIFVGNGGGASVHHPAYNFNDEAMPYGASWFAAMIEARMPTA